MYTPSETSGSIINWLNVLLLTVDLHSIFFLENVISYLVQVFSTIVYI